MMAFEAEGSRARHTALQECTMTSMLGQTPLEGTPGGC